MRTQSDKLINIRRLESDESELFRTIRFEAVSLHPEAYVDTPAELKAYSEEEMSDVVCPSIDNEFRLRELKPPLSTCSGQAREPHCLDNISIAGEI